ncbi:MAG: hypothetical protein KBC67_01285 [Candidatus Pacebacteria bacterium]|nr:hypothetical protein [Candidatus Paceibacterota bacterium]
MKKLLVIIAIAATSISFSGCGENKEKPINAEGENSVKGSNLTNIELETVTPVDIAVKNYSYDGNTKPARCYFPMIIKLPDMEAQEVLCLQTLPEKDDFQLVTVYNEIIDKKINAADLRADISNGNIVRVYIPQTRIGNLITAEKVLYSNSVFE